MNIALWVVQVVLALVFLMAGSMKLIKTKEDLVTQLPYIKDLSQGQIRLIGLLEVLGAIGLLAPALTGILPALTPLAGVGLALTMIGAFATHLRRGDEISKLVPNVVLFAFAVFVAYGRFVLLPL